MQTQRAILSDLASSLLSLGHLINSDLAKALDGSSLALSVQCLTAMHSDLETRLTVERFDGSPFRVVQLTRKALTLVAVALVDLKALPMPLPSLSPWQGVECVDVSSL